MHKARYDTTQQCLVLKQSKIKLNTNNHYLQKYLVNFLHCSDQKYQVKKFQTNASWTVPTTVYKPPRKFFMFPISFTFKKFLFANRFRPHVSHHEYATRFESIQKRKIKQSIKYKLQKRLFVPQKNPFIC